jgi:hypothetical protein
MGTRIVGPPGTSGSQHWRERAGVLVVAGGIVSVIAVYLALNAATGDNESAKDLLPYQTLVRTLAESDQQLYRSLRAGLVAAEAERARTSAWPAIGWLDAHGVAPFAPTTGGTVYQWSRLQQGAIINYFGQPRDPAQPAWLLEIQEPEPGMPPDPAPSDDEHHRLADGTMLHLYVWMHRYGGQVPVGFVRQPQNSGWVEVFSSPPNPVFYNRR